MDHYSTDDRPPTGPPRRPGPGRSGPSAALLWALGLVVTIGLAVLAGLLGIVLGVFGLGLVTLALGLGLLALGAVQWRRAMLPIATIATALMLPGAAVGLIRTRIDPSFGTLVVHPFESLAPGRVREESYTRGVGPILIDLRRFRAERGSTHTINARADSGPIVVALPRDRCFALDVRYAVGDRWISDTRDLTLATLAAFGVGNGSDTEFVSGRALSQRENEQQRRRNGLDPKAPEPDQRYETFSLLTYGRYAVTHTPGRWRRRGSVGGAPVIRLNLKAHEQIVIRDYPDWAGPLSTEGFGAEDQVAGRTWPASVRGPLSPGERGWRTRAAVTTKKNRARWVKWEQEAVPWAAAQARRYAGFCATRDELRDRAVRLYTQPERTRMPSGGLRTLAGGPTTRHSAIDQPIAKQPGTVFEVEVNGLGETRVLRELKPDEIVSQDFGG